MTYSSGSRLNTRHYHLGDGDTVLMTSTSTASVIFQCKHLKWTVIGLVSNNCSV